MSQEADLQGPKTFTFLYFFFFPNKKHYETAIQLILRSIHCSE